MRKHPLGCLTCATLLLCAGAAHAQVPMRVKIDKLQVGFRPYSQDETRGRFKTGLWAPLYVSFTQKPDGGIILPTGKDGLGRGELMVETTDSDDVENIYRAPLALAPNDERPVLTYVKPAVEHPSIRVGVASGGQTFAPVTEEPIALELGEHLYLTLGARLSHFQDALLAMAPAKEREDRDTRPRQAAYENDVQRLPAEWFGYDAIDLMILTTDNNPFLDKLGTDRTRLKAITDWVRRGGRLVVSVAWRNQDKVRALLQSPAWQPPLPDLLPANGQDEIAQMLGVRTWVAAAREKPFPAPGQEPVRVAKLTPGKDAEVLVRERNKEPIIVRVPYGLGNVTLVAFDLDKGPFSVWSGRVEFWKVLLSKLAPRVYASADNGQGMPRQIMDASVDVTTSLQRDLDRFDVAVISFGWVALFILLYILVVGPLDYIILKKVFKRLEWTWVTFPSVVLIVSAVAYFTAYAVKGNDLKINKVDLIDLDLRSDLDAQQQPLRAYAYGTTWFTLLSPRIQNYTVGIGPREQKPGKKADADLAGVLVSWLGRPENTGMGGMGRQRSQGLFRRAYEYAPDGTGLQGVPIPVWSTKSFTASWEGVLPKLPFRIDLHYNPADPEQVSGTVQSKLAASLEDVWIYYGGKWYPVQTHRDDKSRPWKISSDPAGALTLDQWMSSPGQGKKQEDIPVASSRYSYDPTLKIKALLFAQASITTNMDSNHSFRRLDESWRLSSERWQGPGLTREAILYARLPRTADQNPQDSPASIDPALWLGELPGEGKTVPPLPGSLIQDTYLRAYLPVPPGQP